MDKSNREKPIVAKNSTIKTTSYDEVINKLESAKQEFREFEKGQRKALYRSMQRAAETACLVKADETIASQFCKKMGEKDALYAALVFIFDAKTTEKKKEASKRAMALRYLVVKLKVPVQDIAVAIPKNGGIAKLARLDTKSRQAQADEDQDEDQEVEDEDEPEEVDENGEAEHNFGKQISVGLSPKLTRKLSCFADRTRIKIIGYVRTSSDAPMVEATKIFDLGAKVTSKKKRDDDASDWEE
jgi:hypothetical protein